MPTPNEHGHMFLKSRTGTSLPEKVDASLGYEASDVGVTGIVVFVASLFIFVAVCGVLCYGIGKVINARMNKEDGPNSKWTQTVDVRQLGNMPSSPELQNKMAEITQTFPTPRVQTDDGNQDIADLHAREDLLLIELHLGRWVEGQGQNSHRARHGVNCATGIARGEARANAGADDRRQHANRDRAADQWICAHRVRTG